MQRLNPETFDYSIAALQGVYKPTLISTLSTNSATNPSNSTTSGASAGTGIVNGINTFNGGLSQNFRWGGGGLTATLNNNRQTTTSLTALFNPQYNTNWSAQYTQPLLRNFKIDTTRTAGRLQAQSGHLEIQLQALIINTVSNVRNRTGTTCLPRSRLSRENVGRTR